ncbi:MAG: ATP-dependent helicase [Desulfobacteraceae bacterium]|nr:MAG: ATP-dependent helicase [Desulfobacteraceae bacterium]
MPDSLISLTPEQKQIVACDLSPGESLKVVAFAGTGKTSILVEYAKARPQLRFLYLAFNKSVQLEAAQKFPANVTARTSHSLAFGIKGYKHKDRLVSGFRAGTVMDALELDKFEDAKFTIDTLYRYLISASPKVARQHIPYQAKTFYEQCKEPMPDFVNLANRLGRLMCDGSDERIGMLHDGYLKLYQLSSPVLHYDCILLDEAQDINPVTSAFVMAQARPGLRPKAASIILVGDTHQQIYSFRGAKDTLENIQTSKTLFLTRSFRFDNKVARIANMVLGIFKGEKKKVVGTPGAKTGKPEWDPEHYTVIARTNAAIFDKAVQLCRTRKIGFVGGIQGYRLQTIKDVYHLFAHQTGRIMDPFIKRFPEYGDLKAYVEAVEDVELLSVCRVVENYKFSIPQLVRMITEKAVDVKDAQVLLTTAHKSKGLEWPNVHLMGDFQPLIEKDELVDPKTIEPDEFNLVYVAMTRTISRLRFDKESNIPLFIRKVKEVTAAGGKKSESSSDSL